MKWKKKAPESLIQTFRTSSTMKIIVFREYHFVFMKVLVWSSASFIFNFLITALATPGCNSGHFRINKALPAEILFCKFNLPWTSAPSVCLGITSVWHGVDSLARISFYFIRQLIKIGCLYKLDCSFTLCLVDDAKLRLTENDQSQVVDTYLLS